MVRSMVGVLDEMRESGIARGDLVALVIAPEVGVAMATPTGRWSVPAAAEDCLGGSGVQGQVLRSPLGR